MLRWTVLTTGALVALSASLAGCGSGATSGAPATTHTSVSNSAITTSPAAPPAGTATGSDGGPATDDLFPDVVDAVASQADDGTWTFDVTLSSPYDSPARYADAWRILSPAGEQLGIRELSHDHANEQPFTRSLDGVVIPDDVAEVTLEGRDQLNGWGGSTKTIPLPR